MMRQFSTNYSRQDYRAIFERLARQKGINDSGYYDALLTIVDLIEKRRMSNPETVLTVGIAGAQGSGKSTLATLVAAVLGNVSGLTSHVLSLDDFYKTRQERQQMAQSVHPLFSTRGVPGTHDMALLNRVVADLKSGKPGRRPQFNKAEDDRDADMVHLDPVDVILLEGWCWGAKPQRADELVLPVNELETVKDSSLVWRRFVNQSLASDEYQQAFNNDVMIFLAVPDIEAVIRWRTQQEQALGPGSHIMSASDIRTFIMYYERITLAMLQDLPTTADLTFDLNEQHRILLRPRFK